MATTKTAKGPKRQRASGAKPTRKRAETTAETAPARALMLRTCNADLTAYGGFQWPESGPVEDPKWDPRPVCGWGLHGLLWGEGDADYLSKDEDAKWLVCEVDPAAVVDLVGKVKVPRCEVVYCGDRDGAVAYLYANGAAGKAVVFGTATAGARGTATAGDGGTATAGDGGTATAGDGGTATAGYAGTATAGDGGTATAGDGGTATAGDGGTATAGDGGTATAGDGGTATAGDGGTATAGYAGTATAGYDGTIVLAYWTGRKRVKVGYVGEDGILPGVPYRLDDGHNFVRADAPAKPESEASHG